MPSSPFTPSPDQLPVLEHRNGALLVTGAAGTGKTVVLRERFAHLIREGADPERVALVVGSKRAREQAKGLLLAQLSGSLPGIRVLTIHGLAHRVLKQTETEPPEVLSAAEQFAKVRELLQAQDPADWPAYGHLLGVRGFADEVRQLLTRAQEALATPEQIERAAEARGLTGWRELARFAAEYQDTLDAAGQVDYAGLLQRAGVAAGEGSRPFDHVLVDDYHDTTLAAEAILRGLAASDLVVAANPAAHVFSFQGTTDVPLRRFSESFPGSETVALTTRHRSPEGAAIEAWMAPHVSEEHAAIARELRRIHVEQDVPWAELAVVVRRQGSHLGNLLRALDDASIPRAMPERGLSLASEPATHPYILALRWLVAEQTQREELIEPLLTSGAVGLSPAAARGLLRQARAKSGTVAAALDHTDGLDPEEAAAVTSARDTLAKAALMRDMSVQDAFRVLWHELPCSTQLITEADGSSEARRRLDAVVTFANVVSEAGAGGDTSVTAFLESLDAGEHGPGWTPREAGGADAVQVLTAHGAAGLEFHTVCVSGAVEGDFPSLARPEPMFDLATLERIATRSERVRDRLQDERRLFQMVLGTARDRVVLTASGARSGSAHPALASRFADELPDLKWQLIPESPFDEPVSRREAAALWRRQLADPTAEAWRRLAALDGIVALRVDPSRWWFQRDWTDTGQPLHSHLRLSYSRLSHLENCELQHVLGDELGLGRTAGYQAWVGKLVHKIIEDCENGQIEKTPAAVRAAVAERWRPEEFPSKAVAHAYRQLAEMHMLRNWFENYADAQSLSVEEFFEFEFEGVTIVGVIDRIGALASGGTRITDFKSGNADNAPKAEESLQLGIYYLAVQECEDLAGYRPVRAVELAFLKGNWKTGKIEIKAWSVGHGREEAYQTAVRQKLSELIAKKKDLNLTETYRPNPAADCYWCDFRTLCPLWAEGRPVFPMEVAP